MNVLRSRSVAAAFNSSRNVFARNFSAAAAAEKLDVKLYQYEICPFCCKVKAYLDWKGIPYNTKDVNPLSKAEIKFSPQYKKVPIAFIAGQQVNDSEIILESLVENLLKDGVLTDKEAADFQDADAKKWRDWATKDLAVLLFPNLTRNFKESLEAFGYIDKIPHLTSVQKFTNRILGGVAMRLANGKIKKKYNIEDERKALLDCLKTWEDAVGDKPFYGGDRPVVSDVMVFGVLRAVNGFTTWEFIRESAPQTYAWWCRMSDLIPSTRVSRTFDGH